ncbi:hypothetical protein F511_32500 [Dorcoceras hygrometricum]|uniref:Uncharacterized protein n=1 Tax=Dorcoceras hygrometricum TaxID=472368 RepID=A0A2Z7D0M5_9LAMI|nr:hypothetical protein F511_32500 [Dorcoceras hygrometricum]
MHEGYQESSVSKAQRLSCAIKSQSSIRIQITMTQLAIVTQDDIGFSARRLSRQIGTQRLSGLKEYRLNKLCVSNRTKELSGGNSEDVRTLQPHRAHQKSRLKAPKWYQTKGLGERNPAPPALLPTMASIDDNKKKSSKMNSKGLGNSSQRYSGGELSSDLSSTQDLTPLRYTSSRPLNDVAQESSSVQTVHTDPTFSSEHTHRSALGSNQITPCRQVTPRRQPALDPFHAIQESTNILHVLGIPLQAATFIALIKSNNSCLIRSMSNPKAINSSGQAPKMNTQKFSRHPTKIPL